MTKTKTLEARPVAGALALAAALAAAALVLAPAARPGGGSIAVNANPSATTGVFFTVTTGGGQRDFASVAVRCDSGYATVLTVEVPPKGTGTSQTIYPPQGPCTADLEKLMQIGKQHVLASVSFTVGP